MLTPTGSPADDVYCVQAQQNAMEVLLQDDGSGELFTCQGPQDTDNDFYHGDVWCPDGMKLAEDFDTFICQAETDFCQMGGVSDITCDQPLTPANDSWGLYEDNCFRTLHNSQHYYDESCCYLTQINDFTIYQWEEEQGVRIY